MLPAESVAAAVSYALEQPERVNIDELRLSTA
jgi:NADP-dependent 3-hydroxy acid dehydrogenase YdfG